MFKTKVVSVAMLVLALSAPAFAAEKLKVVTTFTVIADMARNVAGDAAEVTSITKPGAEIHEYQPTPGDIRRAQGANLILVNGFNLELWFNRFYQRLKGVPEVTVTAGIEPLGITEGPYNGKPNPHAWMSPDNALIYVDNIRDALQNTIPRMPLYIRPMPIAIKRKSNKRWHRCAQRLINCQKTSVG